MILVTLLFPELLTAVVFSAGAAFGMASDALVHMIHAWQDARAAGDPKPVTAALGLVGHPLLFSGLSTCVISGLCTHYRPHAPFSRTTPPAPAMSSR